MLTLLLNAVHNLMFFRCQYRPTSHEDCRELRNEIGVSSGVYTIYIESDDQYIDVYCDMEFDEGGWVVRETTSRIKLFIAYNVDS